MSELFKSIVSLFQKDNTHQMNWNQLESEIELDKIDSISRRKAVLIFKHSTSCSISSVSLSRLEKNWSEETEKALVPYYLDILANRPLSNAVAEKYNVQHESPQAILIMDGKAIYHESHFGIALNDLLQQV